MNVKEMIVTTRYGADRVWAIKESNKPEEKPALVEKSAAGDIHYVTEANMGNHFQFYARESLSPKTLAVLKTETITQEGSADTTSYRIEYTIGMDRYSDYVREVQIIMPLGGSNSGMFRQPKVGEKVLVLVSDDNKYYLQGFIPETKEDFSTFDGESSIDKSEGQVWRYKNSGTNYTEHPYSEIGFYTNSYERSYRKDAKTVIFEEDPKSFDINEIHIISTGDIKNFASERYSVLADKIILGSGGGSGDPNTIISVDDDGNININAESSINLTVGRTSVSISEEGFSVNTKITESPVSNTFDASLSLRPMEGFIASGMNCTLSGVKSASIGDSMGGSLSCSTGVVGLRGREIKIATYNKTEFKFFMLNNSIDYLFNIMSLADGVHRRDFGSDAIHGERLELFIKWANFARKFFTDGYELYMSRDLINKAKEIQKKHDDEMKPINEELARLKKSYDDKKASVDQDMRNGIGNLYDNEIKKGKMEKIEQETGLVNPTREQFIEHFIDKAKTTRNDTLDSLLAEATAKLDEKTKKINSYYDELDEWDERWTGHNSKGSSKYGNSSFKLNWSNLNPLKDE